MRAKHILLTHFSQRYPKVPPPSAPRESGLLANEKEPVIALAFDHASIRIGSMWKMARYLPAIQQCYDDDGEWDDDLGDLGDVGEAGEGGEGSGEVMRKEPRPKKEKTEAAKARIEKQRQWKKSRSSRYKGEETPETPETPQVEGEISSVQEFEEVESAKFTGTG